MLKIALKDTLRKAKYLVGCFLPTGRNIFLHGEGIFFLFSSFQLAHTKWGLLRSALYSFFFILYTPRLQILLFVIVVLVFGLQTGKYIILFCTVLINRPMFITFKEHFNCLHDFRLTNGVSDKVLMRNFLTKRRKYYD